MVNKKYKLQKLIFNKRFFPSKSSVRNYVLRNDFKLDKRLKRDVENEGDVWSVRQRSCKFFNKKTFKCENIGKGVKGVYGLIKK